MLSGDVESNPGRTNSSRNAKAMSKDDSDTTADILLRLEKKIDNMECGQENIIKNQAQMLARLDNIETEMEKFKGEIEELKYKSFSFESELKEIWERISLSSPRLAVVDKYDTVSVDLDQFLVKRF